MLKISFSRYKFYFSEVKLNFLTLISFFDNKRKKYDANMKLSDQP